MWFSDRYVSDAGEVYPRENELGLWKHFIRILSKCILV